MELKQKQKSEIESLKDNWIYDNYKDYFNRIKDEYGLFKDLTFEEFSKRIKDLMIDNDSETHTPTLLNDDYFNTENVYNNLDSFKEEIKDNDTETLLNFDDDNFMNSEEFYNDDDYYKETLNTIFDYDILNEIKNSYSSYYVSVNTTNINDDINEKDYSNFEEFKNDYENTLYDLDKDILTKKYIYTYHYEVFNWFSDSTKIYENIKDLIKEIKTEIKTELKLRLKSNRKEIKKNKDNILILKEEFKKVISNKEKNINILENEMKQIKEKLKK